jgi:ABC-type nitrate/sulfonate/bicarbonate transport system ATPase subunit
VGAGDAVKNLVIRNLSKTYFDVYAGTQVTAVRDVSLDVPESEFISIVGPSGCGKSTILNMIAGFIPYSSGEILVGGKPVKGPGPDRGVVFQSFALFPWRTVLHRPEGAREDRARISRACKAFGSSRALSQRIVRRHAAARWRGACAGQRTRRAVDG